MTDETTRQKTATVVIDFQNMHLCGWDAYTDREDSPYEHFLDPVKLAMVAAQRSDAVLSRLIICRGLPVKDKASHWYDREQASAWRRRALEEKVTDIDIRLQPLTYFPDGSAREKKVDIDCALEFVGAAMKEESDVIILATHDRDFTPALEKASESSSEIRQMIWGDGDSIQFHPMMYRSKKPINPIVLGIDDWRKCHDKTNWNYAAKAHERKIGYEQAMETMEESRAERMNAAKAILSAGD